MTNRTKLTRRRDDGASVVEYGVLLGLITVIIATFAFAFGGLIGDMFDSAGECLASHVADPSDPTVC